MEPVERFVDVGLKLQVREWNRGGAERPFLLIHGLSSNARTWDGVARVKVGETGASGNGR
ncbi:MAG: hypothetical protein R3D55_05035 [Chloroflexota bacterium]